MAQLLVVACCFLACPLLMGAMMFWIGRDSEGRRLKRELRRINAATDRRRAARDAAVLQQDKTVTATPTLEAPPAAALNGHEWPTRPLRATQTRSRRSPRETASDQQRS